MISKKSTSKLRAHRKNKTKRKLLHEQLEDRHLLAVVAGFAFDDIDADGVQDAGEPRLNGVTFNLSDGTNSLGQVVSGDFDFNADGTVDPATESGIYRFLDVGPNTYFVSPVDSELFRGVEPNEFELDILSTRVAGVAFSGLAVDFGVPAGSLREGIFPGLGFGVAVTTSIHGLNFEDDNSDGVRDAGEVGGSDVMFRLTGTDGQGNAYDQVATTNANGEFSFEGLLPSVIGEGAGTGYTVTAEPPAGYTATTTQSRDFELRGREEIVWQDGAAMLPADDPRTEVLRGDLLVWGHQSPRGVITGLDFEDANANGIFEPELGEVGAAGTTITVAGTDVRGNAFSATTTTSDDGEFQFDNLVPSVNGEGAGTGYTVTRTPLTGDTPTTAAAFTLDLSGGETESIVFGHTFGSSIHGVAFEDSDFDGVFDAGEPVNAGLPYRLFGTDGLGNTYDQTISTDENGEFAFDGLLPNALGEGAGTGYTIISTIPDGSLPTTFAVGTYEVRSREELVWIAGAANLPANDPRREVLADSNEDGIGDQLIFGTSAMASISGIRFEDVNADGTRDADENTSATTTFTLTGTNGQGDAVELTTMSDADGTFGFDELAPGTYTLTETSLAGETRTTTAIDSITLTSGQTVTGLEFGHAYGSSIHGFGFGDLDFDGNIDAGEVGREGLNFRLTGTDGQGNAVDQVATTGANGQFDFDNLLPGNGYSVALELADGSVSVGLTREFDLNSRDEIVWQDGAASLPAGDPRTEVLVGTGLVWQVASTQATIDGFEFEDGNANGVFEPELDEVPAQGTTVTLTGTDGQGGTVEVTTTSDADGNFRFGNLLPSVNGQGQGTGYTITRTPLAGEFATTPNSATVDLQDGATESVVFGHTFGSSIHGVAFEDSDFDGVFEAGEPVNAGLVYRLIGTDGQGNTYDQSTTTDENGEFSFDGLLPNVLGEGNGTGYTIISTIPDGSLPSTFAVGTYEVRSREELVWIAGAANLPAGDPRGEVLADSNGDGVGDQLIFGTAGPGSISGVRFEDVNANASLDANDDTTPTTATFTLTGTNGQGAAVELTTTSDADGAFRFDDLAPGTYTVTETLLDGEIRTVASTGEITLASNADETGLEFGHTYGTSIHGFAFEDNDFDGILDAGEVGISGFDFRLTGTDAFGNAVDQVVTTDADGEIHFNNLLPGTGYQLTPETTVGFLPTDLGRTIDLNSRDELVWQDGAATLPAGDPRAEVLVGDGLIWSIASTQATITGLEFEDANANGVFEPNLGEVPAAGTTITLTGTDGQGNARTETTTTDENGEFRFEDLLPSVDGQGQGTGYTITKTTIPGEIATTPDSYTVNLVGGGTANREFGRTFGSSIHGVAFNDANFDGVFDAGEQVNAGRSYRLIGTDGLGNQYDLATTTDENGEFAFVGLLPNVLGEGSGTGYLIISTIPDGWLPSTFAVGTYEVRSGEELVWQAGAANLPAGDPRMEVLADTNGDGIGDDLIFGTSAPGSISGVRFEDLNADGTRDANETAAPASANFTLTGTDGQGNAVSLTTMSDANGGAGAFRFDNVPPGTYTVTETLLTGEVRTTAPSDTVTVTSGQDIAGLEFGHSYRTSIHGFGFNDLDFDGDIDSQEDGLEGFRFRLTGTDGLGNAVDEIATSDADGQFHFDNLLPGTNYTVAYESMTGFVTLDPTRTYSLFSRNEQVWQDGAANLPAGDPRVEVLVGDRLIWAIASTQAEITGFEFEDVNANGTFEVEQGDTPTQGATIVLTGIDGQGNVVSRTTTTDVNGEFAFNNLLPSVAGEGAGSGYTITRTPFAGEIATTAVTYSADLPGGSSIRREFGHTFGSSIHGVAFEDANFNGVLDAGEERNAGIDFQLLGTDGRGNVYNQVTTTDINGEFAFDRLLPNVLGEGAGTGYIIISTIPDGSLPTTFAVGTYEVRSGEELVWRLGAAGLLPGDPRSEVLADTNDDGIGDDLIFGTARLGSISGVRFEDLQADGDLDRTDVRDEGSIFTLTGTDGMGDAVNLSTTTNADGEFQFDDLAPGVYTLTETLANGEVRTTNEQTNFVLTSGQDITGLEFGFTHRTSIHGFAFHDRDYDDILDASETGLAGFEFRLTGTDAFGSNINQVATTDVNGEFAFDNLLPGSNFQVTPLPQTANTGLVTLDSARSYNLDSREEFVWQTGAANLPADDPRREVLADSDGDGSGDLLIWQVTSNRGSITGSKFEDVNGNGVLEPELGDGPIAGITITLSGIDGQGNSRSQSTVTDANGQFRFNNLLPSVAGQGQGTGYTVTEVLGNGQLPTGNDSETVDLFSSETIDVVFGNTFFGSIHGVAFDDIDFDGVLDPGEPRNGGVAFRLTGTDGLGNTYDQTIFSDANGEFGFNNLLPSVLGQGPGTGYTIVSTIPDGRVPSTHAIGTYEVRSRQELVWQSGAARLPFGDPRTEVLADTNGDGIGDDLIFGTTATGSISGVRFEDLDADGVLDARDNRMDATTTFTLTGTDGMGTAVNRTTTSDNDGTFLFDDVLPGTYTLTETLLNGEIRTTTVVGTIVLTSDQDITDLEFGHTFNTSIHGFAFDDRDYDSDRDASEVGLAGFEFQLTGTDGQGNVIDQVATTDGDGEFFFDDLLAGNYRVTPLTPTNLVTVDFDRSFVLESREEFVWQDGAATLPVGSPRVEVLANGDGDALIWEVTSRGSISGIKYLDQDADGVFEPNDGDQLLEGVVVTLTGIDGQGNLRTTSTTTDSMGVFRFDNLLPSVAGHGQGTGYTITEAVPASHTGVRFQTTPLSYTVDLLGSQTINNLEFGHTFIVSLHGFVFEDQDYDGIYESGSESGLAGSTVRLTGTDGQGNVINEVGTTNSNGRFDFTGLLASEAGYTVTVTHPDDFRRSTRETSSFVVLSGQERVWQTGAADIPFGDPRTEILVGEPLIFGASELGSVSGFKFEDANGNGIYEPNQGDAPLAGVEFTLVGSGGNAVDTFSINQTVTTDANGEFRFDDLLPSVAGEGQGTGYILTETVPNGSFATTSISQSFNLQSGDEVTRTFGNAISSSIHGFKFDDRNYNGIFDATDTAVEGVTFRLTGIDGQGRQVDRGAVSDDTGAFSFTGLFPSVQAGGSGTGYTLTEVLPLNSLASTETTRTFTVRSGQAVVFEDGAAQLAQNARQTEQLADSNQDGSGDQLMFGNIYLGSINGFKFEDLNRDGIYQPGLGDLPQANVEFTLTGIDGMGNAVTRRTLTNDDGEFSFERLFPSVADQGQGTGYTVTEIVPEGYEPTTTLPLSRTFNVHSREHLVFADGPAVGPIDQQQLQTGTDPSFPAVFVGFNNIAAQTFTAGITGFLQEVSITTAASTGTIGDLTLQIRTVDTAGQPSDTALATAVIRTGDVPVGLQGITFDFGVNAPLLVASTRYAMVLVSAETDPPLVWFATSDNPYAAGSTFRSTNGIDWSVDADVDTIFTTTMLATELDVPLGTELVWGNAIPPGEIHGHKFEDINGDAVEDPGEPRLNGWAITLTDFNGNQVVDADGQTIGPQVTRDIDVNEDGVVGPTERGLYWFENLVPGTYYIREVQQDGFAQTTPNPQPITITGGQVYAAQRDQIAPDQLNREIIVDEFLSFGNQVRGEINWRKEDSHGGLLGGVIFTLTQTHSFDPTTGTFRDIVDVPVEVQDNSARDADDRFGLFSVSNLPLGRYSLGETFPVPGYDPDSFVETFEVTDAVPFHDANHVWVNSWSKRAFVGSTYAARDEYLRSIGLSINGQEIAAVADNVVVPTGSSRFALSLLENDYRQDADTELSIVDVGTPNRGGTAELIDGKVFYTPASNADGRIVESFTYTISDGVNTETSTVTPVSEGLADEAISQFGGDRLDVNGDGEVTPLDALMVINDLNARVANGTATMPLDDAARSHDINEDGTISPLDALLVINRLNAENTQVAKTMSWAAAENDDDNDDRSAARSAVDYVFGELDEEEV